MNYYHDQSKHSEDLKEMVCSLPTSLWIIMDHRGSPTFRRFNKTTHAIIFDSRKNAFSIQSHFFHKIPIAYVTVGKV